MFRLDAESIEDLSIGSAVLGTGGGGDPHIGKLITIEAINRYGPVEVIPADALDDDDPVIVVGMSGAPTVMTEKLPGGHELDIVYELATRQSNRAPRASISSEIGGINSLFPVVMAARAGIPLIDGDGRGRATPQIDITTWNAGGAHFGPLFVIDEKGNELRIDGVNNTWQEKIMRQAIVAMGGSVFRSQVMSGADIKTTSVHGTISLALAIGRAIRGLDDKQRHWYERLRDACDALKLFEGKVISIDRRISGGWVRGHAVLSSLDGGDDQQARLDFQNEHVIVRVGHDGSYPRILATIPDLIAVLDSETGTPITTEGMRFGMRVIIIGIPCHPLWRTPRGLELANPRYFGWDIDYVPIEDRLAAYGS